MNNDHLHQPEVRSAETEALAVQAAEDAAEERFDAHRAELATVGKAHEATQSLEFRVWMEARAATDAAWGRWAQAVDAVRA